LLAFIGERVVTSTSNDLTRSPTARLERLGRFGALHSLRGALDRSKITVLLGVAMSRKHLDELLPARIVVLGLDLFVVKVAFRGVEAPGGAMRNDHRLEAPLVELAEKRCWCVRELPAIGRKVRRRRAFGAK
jgi:hypothetical protein